MHALGVIDIWWEYKNFGLHRLVEAMLNVHAVRDTSSQQRPAVNRRFTHPGRGHPNRRLPLPPREDFVVYGFGDFSGIFETLLSEVQPAHQ